MADSDYRRPNLDRPTCSYKFFHFSGFGFAAGSGETAASETHVLLFLLCWLEDLEGELHVSNAAGKSKLRVPLTWKEHSKLSSTLIIAPALSNSPQ